MRYTTLIAFSFVVAAAVGCRSQQPTQAQYVTFPEDMPARSVSDFTEIQSRNGARADATLRSHHFTGGTLNSLGQQKLYWMIPDDPHQQDLNVWLDLDEQAAVTDSRRQAVSDYLAREGVSGERLHIELGVNPSTLHPSREGLRTLRRTEATAPASDVDTDTSFSTGGMTSSQ